MRIGFKPFKTPIAVPPLAFFLIASNISKFSIANFPLDSKCVSCRVNTDAFVTFSSLLKLSYLPFNCAAYLNTAFWSFFYLSLLYFFFFLSYFYCYLLLCLVVDPCIPCFIHVGGLFICWAY